MVVSDRMTSDPITVDVNDSIRVPIDLQGEKGLRRFPVMDGDKLVGIVTDRDLRLATVSSVVVTERRYVEYLHNTIKVESVMTPDPCTATPETSLVEAARTIHEMKIGGLPVVSDGKLVGIITETDLIRTLIDLL